MDAKDTIKMDQISQEKCTEEIKKAVKALAEKDITAAVIMARTSTDLHIFVAGSHGEIEEVIADAIEGHAQQEPDEHEQLEHFLSVGLEMNAVRQQLSQVRAALFNRKRGERLQ